jgi:hypothetical protein
MTRKLSEPFVFNWWCKRSSLAEAGTRNVQKLKFKIRDAINKVLLLKMFTMAANLVATFRKSYVEI